MAAIIRLAGRGRRRFEDGGGDPLDVPHQRFGVVGLQRLEFGMGDEPLQHVVVGVFADSNGDAHGFFTPRQVQQRLQPRSKIVGRSRDLNRPALMLKCLVSRARI